MPHFKKQFKFYWSGENKKGTILYGLFPAVEVDGYLEELIPQAKACYSLSVLARLMLIWTMQMAGLVHLWINDFCTFFKRFYRKGRNALETCSPVGWLLSSMQSCSDSPAK